MPAEVVVVVKNQNARVRSSILREEIACGQAADSSTDDYKVVDLVRVSHAGKIHTASVPQLVSSFKGTCVVSAKSRQGWRIVVGRLLGSELLGGGNLGKQERSGDGRADPVDKVTPLDLAMHAEGTVLGFHHDSILPKSQSRPPLQNRNFQRSRAWGRQGEPGGRPAFAT